MVLALSLLGMAAVLPAGECDRRRPVAPGTAARDHISQPIALVVYQPVRPPASLAARWLGQDKHDFVGPSNRKGLSDVQDIHIELRGLDPRREVVFVDVTGQGGEQWQYNAESSAWKAELRRGNGAPTADLFIEPARIETGRMFHILVRYDDGSTAETDLRGLKADPNLRMAGASLAARWVGQDRQDWTGPGPSVGPDGLQDVRIELSGLGSKAPVRAIRIEGPAGARWEFGTNLKLASNAELLLDEKVPSRGSLFFQTDRDLKGQRLKLSILYENEQRGTATIVAGKCDPKLRMPALALPQVVERTALVKWLGQDGASGTRLGDVHVTVSGLPASAPIVVAVLSDSIRGVWAYRASQRAAVPTAPDAEPLELKLGSRRTSADLFFPPYRDETGARFSLILYSTDGRISVLRFPGGSCDLSRRAEAPPPTRVDAKPGDDLQSLVERYGTVVLAQGIYRLVHPLVLNHPVTLTSQGGATLLFAQSGSDPPWTTAIKIHCGNTTLNGFAVRFEGPIRWNNDVSWGPAVIGMTELNEQGHDELKVNLAFTALDLEVPPVERHDGWVEALRLMRLIRARCGVIARNVLRGGPIEFFDGPWQILENHFRGALPLTFSHAVFTAHDPHDLLVRGNRTRSPDPSGKTWRFLVLTGSSFGDVIEHNRIEEIGARDDDTIPWSNEPEIILTEGYNLKYEGRVMGRSIDGRLLQIGRPQGDPPRPGDVVSLLNGPAAGRWSRIEQSVGRDSYLVDPPVQAQTEVVSVSAGFVSEVIRENWIDIRGGRRSDCLVLPGNIYGARIVKNHFLGGGYAWRLSAYATGKPSIWGWSHVPFLDSVVEGNIVEDAAKGGVLGVEHDQKYIKSNRGRTYMSVRLDDNSIRWSESFLRQIERSGAKEPLAGLTLGCPGSHDPGELVVTAKGNRLESPRGHRARPALVIHAARYNGQLLQNRRLDLAADTTTGLRPANARTASSSR
jgi:hypothetical protein